MKQTKRQSKNAEEFIKWLEENKPHIRMKDKTEYKNLTTAISFICEEHGEYIAQPITIKQIKHGCKLCGVKASVNARILCFEDFIKQSHIIHGKNRYIYDDSCWNGSQQKTKITCTVCNNVFLQTGTSHLTGRGCPMCANKNQQLPFDDFVKKAIEIHGDKYEYSETTWKGSSNKTQIFCKNCNDFFEQLGTNHLRGKGCPVCNTGGFDSEKNFARNPDIASEPCKLYYIKINDSYKIGITKQTLSQRYAGQRFETLLVRETTRLFAWRSEQMILSEFSEYRQRGNIGEGSTECFSTDISTLENFHEIFNSNAQQALAL